jgi:hypothetical protein
MIEKSFIIPMIIGNLTVDKIGGSSIFEIYISIFVPQQN